MTTDPSNPIENGMDAYLDGTLEDEERQRFEARRASDPALRAVKDQQDAVDASLDRLYQTPPGALDRVLREIDRTARARTEQTPETHTAPFYHRPWAIAALFILSAGAAWQLYHTLSQGPAAPGYGPLPWTSVDAFYRQRVREGFKPDWVCKDDQEFADTFRKRMRQPLLLAPAAGQVLPVGIAHLNCITPNSLALLARVGGDPVLVMIDRTRYDKPQNLPADSGLNIFRRVIGSLVLYEVSPLSAPHVLELFYNPDDTTDR